MRAPRPLAVLAFAVLALLGWGAGAAVAGGPTSAMIINLTDGRSASVQVGGAGYDALSRVFDNLGGEGSDEVVEDEPDVRIVWYIHDVTAWRLQSVYLDADGVRVATQTSIEGGSIWDDRPTWSRHSGDSAAQIRTALQELGVIGPVDGSPAAAASGPSDDSEAPTAAAASPAAPSRPAWALAALTALAGAGAGLLAGRLRWGRADRHVERQLDPVAH